MWRVRQYYDPLYCLTVMLLHFAAAWLLMVLVVWENSRRRDKTASLLSGNVNGAAECQPKAFHLLDRRLFYAIRFTAAVVLDTPRALLL